MDLNLLQRRGEFAWEIPRHGAMRVPGVLYASEQLVLDMDRKVYEQVVNVATLKAWATGKGNADKAMMLHAARREWPGVLNDDEADAGWLAAMGAAKLGHEPVEMTAWRVSGLTKGDWPLDGLETL